MALLGQSRFHAVVLKGFEAGQDFVPARASHDLHQSFPLHEIEQRWNDFDVVQKTEVRAGCGIDSDHLHFAGQCNRDLLHNRVLNLARPARGHPEIHQDWSLRLQNLCPEVAF
jgi:hypothetical protein